MEDFKKITVIRPENRKKGDPLIIKNPTNLRLVGKGAQGAVFQISKDRCVKIYGKKEHTLKERKALFAIKDLPFAPKVYAVGDNYIVMEFLGVTSLDKFLKKKRKMPLFVTQQILTMFKQFKRLGLIRQDARIRQLFLTKKKILKAVDHVNAYLPNPPYPVKLLSDLRKLKLHNNFLKQVKVLEPSLYKKWKKAFPG